MVAEIWLDLCIGYHAEQLDVFFQVSSSTAKQQRYPQRCIELIFTAQAHIAEMP